MATTQDTHPSHSLVSIPQETIEHIFKFCHPRDLASLSETCKALYKIIYSEDQYIWRETFLAYPFDDIRLSLNPVALRVSQKSDIPESGPDEQKLAPDWRTVLQRRIFAEVILRRPSVDGSDRLDILKALRVLIDAVTSSAPIESSNSIADLSHNLAWVQDIVLHSAVLKAYDMTANTDSKREHARIEYMIHQLCAQLRCYVTLAHEKDLDRSSEVPHLALLRSAGRCFVYDLRNYDDHRRWGPYNAASPGSSDEGEGYITVNWKHVEHIRNVVFMNLAELPAMWRKPAIPSFNIQSTRPHSAPGYNSKERNPRDWAGVEGVWRRVVCFMDYRDLFAFNFTTSSDMRLKPAYFDSDFAEATRIVEAHFTLDNTPSSLNLPLEEDDDPDPRYPPLEFIGTARGIHLSQSSRVHGTIRKKKGYVRWTFVTTHDRSRWAAEGVQVGNIGSALGVAGIWTVAVHEDNGDPAGPFWMWKAEESLPDRMLVLQDY